ncbi:MAG TPA: type IV toxin-antitoxin system AbiEi family antitoxin [Acidobacteriota bacterium]|nr:type IV toxin-antitoxin system AbiEi family antitoxin [Acidobacteriota bacterium]
MDTLKPHDRDILEEVLAAAQRLGINAQIEQWQPNINGGHADAWIVLQLEGKKVRYTAEVKRGLRPVTLGAVIQQLQRLGEKPLLIADHVTPQLADTLRNHGISFIDTAGNAYINHPPLLVWVKGERPIARAIFQHTGRAFQASGLQVIFALLCNQGEVDRPYREIAKLAGVAHGTVGLVMAELPKLGFIAEVGKKRRLLQPERLLQQWVEAYARTLRPKLLLGRFKTETLAWWKTVDPNKYDLKMGGEGAAARLTNHLRPGTLTFFGPKAEPLFLLDQHLKTDPNGEVEILRRFWQFKNPEPALAPTLLVYADLLAIGDAHCLETAKLLYDQISLDLTNKQELAFS